MSHKLQQVCVIAPETTPVSTSATLLFSPIPPIIYMGVWVKTANLTSGYVMPTLGVWENGNIVSIGYVTQDTDWTYLHGSWTAASNEDRIQIQLPCATLLGPIRISA